VAAVAQSGWHGSAGAAPAAAAPSVTASPAAIGTGPLAFPDAKSLLAGVSPASSSQWGVGVNSAEPETLTRSEEARAARSGRDSASAPAADAVAPGAAPPPAPAVPPPAPEPPPAPAWVRPDVGPLSSGFGYRWGALHAGIDLAGPYGSPIVAVGDGTVTFAGPSAGYGNLITIEHPDGTATAYGHMSKILVTGGPVHAGEEIALEGSEGHSTGPHLHFEVRIGGSPVDPIPWLAAHGVGM
jgi:murein DD-endopeptidase MepM/ murein hydrolase activator NlpD